MKRTVESASIASLGISIVKKQQQQQQPSTTPDSQQQQPSTTPGSQQQQQQQHPSVTPDSQQQQQQQLLPPFTQRYECDNFEFLTLKQGNITIESDTGIFLCNHGYSFDALFTRGIPFTPPADMPTEPPKNKATAKVDMKLFNLWKHMMDIMRHRKIPLVLHNGLYDLMYIYHSFIGKLPDTFAEFISTISHCFPSGIYDTRYLAERAEYNSTFLKYVFSKSDRLRQDRFENSTEETPYFEVQVNPPILKTGVPLSGLKRKRDDEEVKAVTIVEGEQNGTKKLDYCKHYAERGYCNLGHTGSSKYHDIQIILDHQMGVSKYKQFYTSESDHDDNAHAAHFDAYMTSFAFAYFQNTLTPLVMKSSFNKMAISGLHFPLTFPIPASTPSSSQNV
ncbi:ribonuclease CAF1 [Pilaira anomala]|nr:ribonuclease CAF1 [Pilaira anomala]